MLISQKNFIDRILSYSMGGPGLLGAALLLFSPGVMLPAYAVEVPTLFTAEVAFDQKSRNPREDAYKAALLEVITRVSGAELSADKSAVDEMFPVPSAYVTQFRPTSKDTLWVSFDGDAIERVLRANGQTVWGADRPLTMVWLAVDWGRGEREIVAAGDPERSAQQSRSIDRNRLLRERLLEIAQRRGLPLAFPLLDTIDLQSVTFSDIWGGFDDRVVDASRRYEANSILIGRIRASSNRRNRWTYVFGGETRSWTGEPESIVAQIADLLAAEFTVGGDAPVESVAVNVSGIDTVDKYGSLQALLAGVSLIEAIKISEVAGDTISYQVDVRGGATRLRRALRFSGLLEQEARFGAGAAEEPGPRGTVLEFYYGDSADIPSASSSPNVL